MNIYVKSVADIKRKVKLFCELYDIAITEIACLNIVTGEVNGKGVYQAPLNEALEIGSAWGEKTEKIKIMKDCTLGITFY